MMENFEKNRSDAMFMVQIRNAFYRKKYYHALGVYSFCIVIIVILLVTAFYLYRNPTKPVYFVADDLGRLLPNVPLSQPNMTDQEATDWVTQALQDTLSYDYVNFRGQLQYAQRYFTDYGWRNYLDALNASQNLVALTQRKLIIISKVSGVPKISTKGILAGAYAWQFQVPILSTYMFPPFDDRSQYQNPLNYSVIVQRQPLINSYRGLGIVQMIGNIAITQPIQPLTASPQ